MARYRAPRGTFDILPEDWPYWNYVISKAREVAALYGYQEIETPIFESTSLFVRGVGEGTDIVDKEMYSFKDKGKTDLTLRPEFTAGVMRAYVEHGMHTRPKPVKLFSIGPLFRYERPQAGRFREFHQFNVEAIGSQDPALDFEIMSMAWQFLEELGFKGLSFQINSTGCPKCRPIYVEALKKYYMEHYDEICEDDKRRLERNPLRVLDCKNPKCQPVIAGAPKITDYLCDECRDHFSALRRYLDTAGKKYTLNHRLVRGLDYYTKTVFEVWAAGIGAQNAVCGGGRYDGLVEEIGGPPTPGVGFAVGIERVVMMLKAQGVKVPEPQAPEVFVAYLGESAKEEAVMLSQELRSEHISAILSFDKRGLKGQLRDANRWKAKYTIIIGEEEIARGEVTVRDMESGEQSNIERKTLIGWLREKLGKKS